VPAHGHGHVEVRGNRLRDRPQELLERHREERRALDVVVGGGVEADVYTAAGGDVVGVPLDLLQQALAKDPNSGAAYSMLAKLYYSEGEIDKASEAIAKALELGPHQPDFLYVQGKILEKQGKLDEALASFTQTTLINPQESDAYFEIGVIYQQRKDLPRATAAYKRALEISPQDPDYRRALASISSGAPISSEPKVDR